MKKYDEKLKSDIIASIIEDGFTITEAAKMYGIDRRRVGELMKNLNKKSKIDIKAKNSTSTKVEIEKNITNTSKSEESVENILNKNGISLKEWELNTVSINNWTDSSNVVHYQTKISLVKKVIDLTYEIPAPISIKIKNDSETKKVKKSNLKCAVILPDMQVGFRRNINTGELVAIHDREAMDIALQIVQYLSPDRIVLLGDNLDLAEFSTKYTTPADMAYTTQASLVELAWWLGKLRSFDKNTKIDYIGGNHDERLNRFIESKANILSGLKPANALKGHASISVPALLGLDDIDVEYHNYPQGKVALNSNLVCVHGEVAKGQSGATVSELVKSARVSVIQGHIHRHEIATKTTWDAFNNSYQYTAASFGCLCKIDPGFVPGMKYLQNWQNGIGVVWYEDCGLEQFRMEYIPIIKGRALYQKEIFECESDERIAMRIEKETRYKVT